MGFGWTLDSVTIQRIKAVHFVPYSSQFSCPGKNVSFSFNRFCYKICLNFKFHLFHCEIISCAREVNLGQTTRTRFVSCNTRTQVGVEGQAARLNSSNDKKKKKTAIHDEFNIFSMTETTQTVWLRLTLSHRTRQYRLTNAQNSTPHVFDAQWWMAGPTGAGGSDAQGCQSRGKGW